MMSTRGRAGRLPGVGRTSAVEGRTWPGKPRVRKVMVASAVCIAGVLEPRRNAVSPEWEVWAAGRVSWGFPPALFPAPGKVTSVGFW